MVAHTEGHTENKLNR